MLMAATARPDLHANGVVYCDFMFTVTDCEGGDYYRTFITGHIPLAIIATVLGILHYIFRVLVKKSRTFYGWRLSGTDGVLLVCTIQPLILTIYIYWLINDWPTGGRLARAIVGITSIIPLYFGVTNWASSMIFSLKEASRGSKFLGPFGYNLVVAGLWSAFGIGWGVALIMAAIFGHFHDLGEYELEQSFHRAMCTVIAACCLVLSFFVLSIAFQFHSFLTKHLGDIENKMESTTRKKTLVEYKKMRAISGFAAGGVLLSSVNCVLMGYLPQFFTSFPGWSQFFHVMNFVGSLYTSSLVILILLGTDIWTYYVEKATANNSSNELSKIEKS